MLLLYGAPLEESNNNDDDERFMCKYSYARSRDHVYKGDIRF